MTEDSGQNSEPDYVTGPQLEETLQSYLTEDDLKRGLKKGLPGFGSGAGKALYSLAQNVVAPVVGVGLIATVAVAVGCGFASCCSYGPFDATRVAYHEFFGNPQQAKHEDVQYAEARYARLLRKDTLEPEDVQNLYFEIGAPRVKGRTSTEDDLAWKRVLDWIEDNPAPEFQ